MRFTKERWYQNIDDLEKYFLHNQWANVHYCPVGTRVRISLLYHLRVYLIWVGHKTEVPSQSNCNTMACYSDALRLVVQLAKWKTN